MNYRSKGDRYIDRAHSEVANAEMMIIHSYTDDARNEADARFASAQAFLRLAVETKRAWDATDHDEYEEYPEIEGI